MRERVTASKTDAGLPADLSKVPQVTLAFWIIKILSTTVGETGADYLAVHAGLGTAATAGITGLCLLAALVWQLRSHRYRPWPYWFTVVLLSVVGTQITDAITDGLGVSLYLTTPVFALFLGTAFVCWYSFEGTLSIESIYTKRRELFYWSAILLTFALGTAAGDLATEALGMGFRLGILIFGGLIAAAAIARGLGVNAVLAFWTAYILTRPLGASLGDFLSQASEYGGLGWGSVTTSIAFGLTIAAMVAYLAGDVARVERRIRDLRASRT